MRSKVSGLSFRGVELETEWLLLRGWLGRDLEPYARICAEPEVMSFIGDGSTLTRKQSGEQISYFVRHWQERGFGLWAVEEKASGAFVGFAGLAHQEDWIQGERKTEVRWRFGRAFWGRGLATEVARASVDYGFEGLGLEEILRHHPARKPRLPACRAEGRAHPTR